MNVSKPHLPPQSVDGTSAADQMAALLGPDQMAALLGPSWKSRQPRMCQYCQRMFSNKFNLKQVHCTAPISVEHALNINRSISAHFEHAYSWEGASV